MKFGATQQLPEIDRWGQMGKDGERWGWMGIPYSVQA